jgi:enediyne biosynthesis protein E4
MQFGFLPQFEKLDGSFGELLINNRQSDFKWIENKQSGLNMRGEMRDIKAINQKQQQQILFLQNNDYPVLYRLNKNSLPNN